MPHTTEALAPALALVERNQGRQAQGASQSGERREHAGRKQSDGLRISDFFTEGIEIHKKARMQPISFDQGTCRGRDSVLVRDSRGPAVSCETWLATGPAPASWKQAYGTIGDKKGRPTPGVHKTQISLWGQPTALPPKRCGQYAGIHCRIVHSITPAS